MIDRQRGCIVIECDSCDATFDGKSGEWNEVCTAAKRDGWKSKKIGSEWVHACQDCEVDDGR